MLAQLQKPQNRHYSALGPLYLKIKVSKIGIQSFSYIPPNILLNLPPVFGPFIFWQPEPLLEFLPRSAFPDPQECRGALRTWWKACRLRCGNSYERTLSNIFNFFRILKCQTSAVDSFLSPVFRFSDIVPKIVSNTKDEMPFSYLRINIREVTLYHQKMFTP